jgi:hypothetical protein
MDGPRPAEQHEGVRVGAKLGDDERDPLRHEPRDEGNVTREPVQFGDNDGAMNAAGLGQGGG